MCKDDFHFVRSQRGSYTVPNAAAKREELIRTRLLSQKSFGRKPFGFSPQVWPAVCEVDARTNQGTPWQVVPGKVHRFCEPPQDEGEDRMEPQRFPDGSFEIRQTGRWSGGKNIVAPQLCPDALDDLRALQNLVQRLGKRASGGIIARNS